MVPYESVVAAEEIAATAPSQSPPPTFAAATTADGLMDRRNVVSDTAQGEIPSSVSRFFSITERLSTDNQISGVNQTKCKTP